MVDVRGGLSAHSMITHAARAAGSSTRMAVATHSMLTHTARAAGSSTRMAVAEVVDIEEMVWAPRFGLKGQVDATLGVVMGDLSGPAASRWVARVGAPY